MKQKMAGVLVIMCISMIQVQAVGANLKKEDSIISPYMLLWENYMVTKIIIIKKKELTNKKEKKVMHLWQTAIRNAVEKFKKDNPKKARKSTVHTEICPIRRPSKKTIDLLIAKEIKKTTFGDLVRLGVLIVRDDSRKGITGAMVGELTVPDSVFIYVVNEKTGEYELLF